jgi:hypothetical protein
MKALYRLSDNSYEKVRFKKATKLYCLENFLKHFPAREVVLFADKVREETFEQLKRFDCTLIRTEGGSSAGGFRVALQYAISLPDEEIVYFVEDDYLHLEGSRALLLEGLRRADYVSLYDHLDKYKPANSGGNPAIGADGAEATKVFLTQSSHWKLTNSTTMTFACRVGTLREDFDDWAPFIAGTHPYDYHAFLALGAKGRTLITPIPGRSTHCEPDHATPFVDWSRV